MARAKLLSIGPNIPKKRSPGGSARKGPRGAAPVLITLAAPNLQNTNRAEIVLKIDTFGKVAMKSGLALNGLG
jgi:hypothetical protein